MEKMYAELTMIHAVQTFINKKDTDNINSQWAACGMKGGLTLVDSVLFMPVYEGTNVMGLQSVVL